MAGTSRGEALARERRAMVQVSREVRALEFLTLAQLQKKHLELFGEESHTKNKTFLKKKVAFRIQERAEGGISPEAKARIAELAPALLPERKEAKQRLTKAPVSGAGPATPPPGDPRLPEAGTVLQRDHQGKVHEVEVLAKGFRYLGHVHRSLSAVAKAITGTNWNGFLFFGLVSPKEKA